MNRRHEYKKELDQIDADIQLQEVVKRGGYTKDDLACMIRHSPDLVRQAVRKLNVYG